MLSSHGFMQKECVASVTKCTISNLVPADKLWYIDMPWPGDRYNLAMVAGSNHLLTYLDTKKENHVRVLVRPSKIYQRDMDLSCYTDSSRTLSQIHLY